MNNLTGPSGSDPILSVSSKPEKKWTSKKGPFFRFQQLIWGPLSKKHPGWHIAFKVIAPITLIPGTLFTGLAQLFVKQDKPASLIGKPQPPPPAFNSDTPQSGGSLNPLPDPQLGAPPQTTETEKTTPPSAPVSPPPPSLPVPHVVSDTLPAGSTSKKVTFAVDPIIIPNPRVKEEVIPKKEETVVVPNVSSSTPAPTPVAQADLKQEVAPSTEEAQTPSRPSALPIDNTLPDSMQRLPTSGLQSSGTMLPLHQIAEIQRAQAKVAKTKRPKKILKRSLVSPAGEVLSQAMYDVRNQLFAHDCAVRAHTVPQLEKSIHQQLEEIKRVKQSLTTSPSPMLSAKLSILEKSLENQRDMLSALKNINPEATWASTDSPRAHFRFAKDIFKEIFASTSRKKANFLSKKFLSHTDELIPGKAYALPILGNLRHQAIYVASDKDPISFKDEDFKAMIENRSPKGKIFDPKIIERYNLYLELTENKKTVAELSRQDPAYAAEIKSIAQEAGLTIDGLARTPVIHYLESVKIPYFEKAKRGINRSAAISDFTHGETNYQDLKTYQTMLEQAGEPDLKTNSKKLQAVLKKQGSEFRHAYPEKGLEKKSDLQMVKQAVNEALIEREAHLMQKVLQDLALHLENEPVGTSKTLFLGRVGFVDTTKDKDKDPDGFMLDERNQALDSAAAYRLLQGKELRFDLEDSCAPRIDLENPNIIHLPKKYRTVNDDSPVKLYTAYLNISVAGNVKNEKDQQVINKEGLKMLSQAFYNIKLTDTDRARANQLLNELKNDLKLLSKSKVDEFEVTDKVLELMNILGYASGSCYGGKDRTGYVFAVRGQKIMKDHLIARDPNEESYKNDKKGNDGPHIQEIKRRMWAKNGVLVSVIRDNVDIEAVKIKTANLNIFEGNFLMGLGIFGGNVGQILKPKWLSKNKKGEGDLYDEIKAEKRKHRV